MSVEEILILVLMAILFFLFCLSAMDNGRRPK